MNKPKVSVIIPVYNTQNYLKECLNSVCNQTLKEIEIICVDDGSTDNSLLILRDFKKKDSRIITILQKNKGVSFARNRGLKKAKSDIVMFLDSDDYISENACEKIYSEFQSAPCDIVCFGAQCFPMIPEPDPWYPWILSTQTKNYTSFTEDVLFREGGSVCPFIWNKAFSRLFLKKNRIRFLNSMAIGEDLVFQFHAFPHSNYISFFSDTLYFYRWNRENSAMDTVRKDRFFIAKQHICCAEMAFIYWKKQGWMFLYGSSFLKWMLKYITPQLEGLELTQKLKLQKQVIKLIESNELLSYNDKDDKEVVAILESYNTSM